MRYLLDEKHGFGGSPTRKTVAIVLCLLMMAATGAGQFIPAHKNMFKAKHDLAVDVAYFPTEEPEVLRLELYYQIYNQALGFQQEDDRYVADYELLVEVLDNDKDLIESFTRRRQVIVSASEEHRLRTDHRTSQINLEVAPGKYIIRFTLTNPSDSRVFTREKRLKVEKLHQRNPRLSLVEFVQAFRDVDQDSSVFVKNNVVIVPSVAHAFGGTDSSKLVYYFEIWPGLRPPEKVVVETRIRHYRKGLLYRDTLHVKLEPGVNRQMREVSLDPLWPGSLELEITLRGRRSKELARRTSEFKVIQSREQMIRNDWKTVVEQLKVLGPDIDVDDLKALEDFEERKQGLRAFWEERDITPGTVENEAMIVFYYRVRVANEKFGYMRRAGWESDRGRIYIRFGPPDHLFDEPYAMDQRSFQIWHYTNQGRYRRFVFIDEKNDGDYRLQFPYDGLNQRPDF